MKFAQAKALAENRGAYWGYLYVNNAMPNWTLVNYYTVGWEDILKTLALHTLGFRTYPGYLAKIKGPFTLAFLDAID